MEEFEKFLGDKPNQVERKRDDVEVSADQLLDVPATPGEIAARYPGDDLAPEGAESLYRAVTVRAPACRQIERMISRASAALRA